ncbi:MAG: hypothetical protein JNL50_04045, partial [Phycisphaerae bacterium]|nr:hypothetical protein [Phycisphaerae bacterium]
MESSSHALLSRRALWVSFLMLAVCAMLPRAGATAANEGVARGGSVDGAQWLSTGVEPDGRPCPLFRGEFTLDQDVTKATLSIVGLGHYRATINGQ